MLCSKNIFDMYVLTEILNFVVPNVNLGNIKNIDILVEKSGYYVCSNVQSI